MAVPSSFGTLWRLVPPFAPLAGEARPDVPLYASDMGRHLSVLSRVQLADQITGGLAGPGKILCPAWGKALSAPHAVQPLLGDWRMRVAINDTSTLRSIVVTAIN